MNPSYPAPETARFEDNLLPLEKSVDDGPRAKGQTPASKHSQNTEAMINRLLNAHSARLEPDSGSWLLRYPLATGDLERRFGSFEASLPIIGESREDALMITKLVLRGHEPPENQAEPTTEQPPPAKLAARRSIDPTRRRDRRRPADMSAYQLARAPFLDTTP